MINFQDVSVIFKKKNQNIQALSDVSFSVPFGSSFGIIGESGSGKTTILNVLAGLVVPTGGSYNIGGSFQYVFQDPYSSLHPYHTIGKILEEPLRVRGDSVDYGLIRASLRNVGLEEDCYFRFPHQLSGGQRQRVCIARALVTKADILLLDEPTSALDVSVQAEILNLLKDLQERHGFTMVFVSHDLPVISFMCEKIIVMRYGKMVEILSSNDLRYKGGISPYTNELVQLSFFKELSNNEKNILG